MRRIVLTVKNRIRVLCVMLMTHGDVLPVQIDSSTGRCILRRLLNGAESDTVLMAFGARWQSGYAADCNSVYAGSIPTLASIL